jgi:hypothetical protein
MRYSALLVIAAVCSVAGSGGASATGTYGQSSCPPEAAGTRAKVARFLTSADFTDERQTFGVGAANPTGVVLLTDASHAAICEQLRAMVGQPQGGRYPKVPSYYSVDGFYFVSFSTVVPQGRMWLGFAPLVVLRSDFTYLGTFAM